MAILRSVIQKKKRLQIFARKPAGPWPVKVMADHLNVPTIDHSRNRAGGRVRIHVSELIRSEKRFLFCPREHVLHHLEAFKFASRGLSPGFDLLFSVGHAIHDHARNRFIKYNPLGRFAYGVWKCACGHTFIEGVRPTNPDICKKCNTETIIYHEMSLYHPDYKIVGHPDFVIKYSKKFILYEIKTVDRVDVIFDEMRHALGDHQLQGTFYYYLMKYLGMDVDPLIRYLYVDRSTSKLFSGTVYKEFQEKVSPGSRIKPFLEKATEVITALDKKELPKRICEEANCPRAKQCKVAVSCFARRAKNFVLPKTLKVYR